MRMATPMIDDERERLVWRRAESTTRSSKSWFAASTASRLKPSRSHSGAQRAVPTSWRGIARVHKFNQAVLLIDTANGLEDEDRQLRGVALRRVPRVCGRDHG